jgi:hypothetical protein
VAKKRSLLALGAAVAVAGVAGAHHSPAAFDRSREVLLEGSVTKFAYANPHTYLSLDVTGPDGRVVSQEVEVGPVSVVQALGLERDSLQVGDHVTVRANPSRRGAGHTVMGLDVTLANGSVLPLHLESASVRPTTHARSTSIAGTWYPAAAGFTSLFLASSSWRLTEAGRTAFAESRRTNRTTHADCVPAGAPMLMLYPVVSTVRISPDTVMFDIDWLDAQRVVHLGTTHPTNLAPTLQGHSVGRWEGDVLVVETIGFAPHAEGIGYGMPSSEQKRLVERFALEPDGRQLRYEVTVEDPVYLLEPIRHSAEWVFRPDLQRSGIRCDLEVARQYLREDAPP